jgi:hypothetical protein
MDKKMRELGIKKSGGDKPLIEVQSIQAMSSIQLSLLQFKLPNRVSNLLSARKYTNNNNNNNERTKSSRPIEIILPLTKYNNAKPNNYHRPIIQQQQQQSSESDTSEISEEEDLYLQHMYEQSRNHASNKNLVFAPTLLRLPTCDQLSVNKRKNSNNRRMSFTQVDMKELTIPKTYMHSNEGLEKCKMNPYFYLPDGSLRKRFSLPKLADTLAVAKKARYLRSKNKHLNRMKTSIEESESNHYICNTLA